MTNQIPAELASRIFDTGTSDAAWTPYDWECVLKDAGATYTTIIDTIRALTPEQATKVMAWIEEDAALIDGTSVNQLFLAADREMAAFDNSADEN